jgi:hypothetical protein
MKYTKFKTGLQKNFDLTEPWSHNHMNEILFNDKFQRVWCRYTLSGIAKTLKPSNSRIDRFVYWFNW